MLFRTEDLSSNISSYLDRADFIQQILKLDELGSTEEILPGQSVIVGGDEGFIASTSGISRDKIFRNLTFKYNIEDGQLVSEKNLLNVENITQYDHNTLSFVPDTLNLPNGLPFFVEENKFGINPSPWFFSNHNLSVQRPLTTTVNKIINQDTSNNFAKYGFDNEIRIIPTYNFYLKEYEEFFNTYTNPDSNLAPEKVIPNYYYTLLFLRSLKSSNESPLILNFVHQAGQQKGLVTLDAFLKTVALQTLPFELTVAGLREELVYEVDETLERNSVVMLTSDFYKSYNNDIEIQKNLFPYHIEIDIPVVKGGTVFRDVFKQTNLYDDLQYTSAMALKVLSLLELKQNESGGLGAQIKLYLQDLNKQYDIYKLLNEEASDDNVKTQWEKSSMPVAEFPFHLDRLLSLGLPNYTLEDLDYPFELENNKNVVDVSNVGARQRIFQVNKNVGPLAAGLALADIFQASTNQSIKDILENLFTPDSTFTAPLVFFGTEKEKNNYISSISFTKLREIIGLILQKAQLNAASVFNNKENYSEILFFEVVKYDRQPVGITTPVQRFLLPNDPDFDEVKYFDSQVKYNKFYWYQIYAHTLSVGNRLERNSMEEGFKWKYNNELSVKLLRVPYYNIEGIDLLENDIPGNSVLPTIISDAPPLPPDVTFFPYKNVSNKIAFWFNVQLGELMMKPVGFTSLNTSEQMVNLANYLTSLSLLGDVELSPVIQENEILYKTDDFGGVFEIFRTTERPDSYLDFEDKKIATVDVIGAKTFIDDIIPNQDYYYTFRAVDVHNLPSNPSPVYHFKMITHNDAPEANSTRIGSDGAQPVLFSEIINLDDNYEKKIAERSFKKYLLIEPSLKQSFLDFKESQFDQEGGVNTALDVNKANTSLALGNAEVKLFGKKFKIRITSKQTGRMLDVNVHFKNPEIKEIISDTD